ncbi:MAG: hypothetical protein R6W06_11095 [Prochlorococcaceae cyanobacterium]
MASELALLQALEECSRSRPDRVLRLRGVLRAGGPGEEPFELLIFRGFSSSTTHPTGFDPDQPVLAQELVLRSAELLAGPLNPEAEQLLAGPELPAAFLEPAAWC